MKKFVMHGAIPVNCYIIEKNGKCLVVDPGYRDERLESYIAENGLEVVGVLLTHGHLDHIGGVDAFGVPVYLGEKEFELFKDDALNGFGMLGIEKPFNVDDVELIALADGEIFDFEGEKIEVIWTPGHTAGGVCFKWGNDLITGDTLFEGSIGRADFPTGNGKILMESVARLIEGLPEEMKIHPGHGASSTIGAEKRENGFYLAWKRGEQF